MDEKNLDDNNSGETPRSPMENPTETDPKQNDETEKTVNDGNHIKEKEEGDGDGGVEAASESESPLPCIEKVSKDIDEFLVSLVEQKEKEATSFGVPGFVERFLDLMEEKISKYDVEGKAKWGEVPEEDALFLELVTRISKLMKSLTLQMDSTPPPPSSEGEEIKGMKDSLVNRIGLIQQRVMSYLEEDFRYLLEESRNNPTELDSSANQNQNHVDHKGKQHEMNHEKTEESDQDFPGYSNDAILNLNKIAGAMLCGGYQSECSQVYIISRRNALEESLRKLGFEKISIDEMQKVQWETLARDMVPTWINTFKQCASMYFSSERKLAEAVFVEHPNVAAGLFSNLSRGVVIQLLNFAEGAAMTKRAGEKLFKLLDMYETLRDVILKLDELFPEECVEELKTEMTLAKCRLGEATISIFCDLEISIKSETAKTPVPGGAVHPLTRYIMNYLNIAGDYRETLEQIKGSSEMARLMGDTWCRKRSSELRTYHKNYQRETWNRVVACLTHEGLNVNGKVQKPVLKERFKSFNALFDEIHRTQSTWVVKDEQLQSELRVSISAVVIPAYRSFLGRFAQYLDTGRQTEKYVKYQAEDIETYIDDLFDGKPHQSIGKRKT
ncbi:unnamed protein product [Lupinus luteus]|uniref:Exocyst subunit Exo70 family protein n=1 Tax=Lupinus luteus TaxID=3873 RepID=A0AAV1XPG0_LUPLU